MPVDLSSYNNSWYKPGHPFKRGAWYLVNMVFFKSSFFPFYGFKRGLLRWFGATVGIGVLIKPGVNIKYPWKLVIGNHVWIGEAVWIDNLELVTIGNDVCISQGAFLLCGNHDYKSPAFDLIVKPITLEDEVWIGAKAIVAPGVTCRKAAVLAVGSVAGTDLEAGQVYQGNPAEKVKARYN
ncbi:MAG: WcaF family extracellular polysaccharide biosynthesis acetyltransferase [Ferruginibacter sp.]